MSHASAALLAIALYLSCSTSTMSVFELACTQSCAVSCSAHTATCQMPADSLPTGRLQKMQLEMLFLVLQRRPAAHIHQAELARVTLLEPAMQFERVVDSEARQHLLSRQSKSLCIQSKLQVGTDACVATNLGFSKPCSTLL